MEEAELDLRVQRMRELAPERNDLHGAAAVTTADAADDQAEALLRDTELRLHLDPDRLARLLSVAVALAGGAVEREGELYRLARVPAGWSRLVDDHLRIRRGSQQGACPGWCSTPTTSSTAAVTGRCSAPAPTSPSSVSITRSCSAPAPFARLVDQVMAA